MTQSEQLISHLPEEAQKRVREIMESFGYAIASAALRSGDAQHALLEELDNLAGKLQHAAVIGNSNKPLSESDLDRLFAGVVGARMVLTPGREQMTPEVEPVENAAHAHRFLDLVRTRVGEPLEGKEDTAARIRMRIVPGDGSPTLIHNH